MDSRDSSFDSDPSRPLNPNKSSRPATPGSLNPEMVYHPPATRAAGQLRDGTDGDNGKSWHLGGFVVTASVVLRLLTGVFTFSAGIAGAVKEPLRPIEIILVILDFITLSWSLATIVFSCSRRDRKKPIISEQLSIPEVSLTVGKWKYFYCGDEESIDYEDAEYDDLVMSARKKVVQAPMAPVDGIIVVLYLFFTIISLPPGHKIYSDEQSRIAIAVLHWFIIVYEVLLFILDHTSDKTGFTISISAPNVSWIRENSYKYQIQLPQDDEMAGAGSRQPVSADT